MQLLERAQCSCISDASSQYAYVKPVLPLCCYVLQVFQIAWHDDGVVSSLIEAIHPNSVAGLENQCTIIGLVRVHPFMSHAVSGAYA